MIQNAYQLSHILFEANAEGMIKCSETGHILDANTIFLRMLGYNSTSELESAKNSPAPHAWQIIEQDIIQDQVLKTGISRRFQKEYYHQDGSLVHVQQILWSTPGKQHERVVWGLVRNLSKEKSVQHKFDVLLELLKKTDSRRNQILEEGCKWIAAEIHDSIGQQLTAISLELDLLKNRVGIDRDADAHIGKIIELTDETLQKVRNICKELRPMDHISDNGVEAIRVYSKKWEKRTGIQTEIKSNLEYLGPHLSTVCYRIVQEALTNVSRHAEATRVGIEIRQDDKALMLTIHDNGVGIPAGALDDPGSLGLIGIKESTEAAGGKLSIVARQGTLVKAVFDMKNMKQT